MKYLTMEELEAGLDNIYQSPKNEGVLELIVRRPETNKREVLKEANLDLVKGLIGDNWINSSSSKIPGPNHEKQINIMNSRTIALIAQEKDRWQLAGDQLYIDFDLSIDNLPSGTRMAIGTAIIEVTPEPHTGCKKFVERFGLDAMKFVNSTLGRQLNLRGINAKVIQSGMIRIGDVAKKI